MRAALRSSTRAGDMPSEGASCIGNELLARQLGKSFRKTDDDAPLDAINHSPPPQPGQRVVHDLTADTEKVSKTGLAELDAKQNTATVANPVVATELQ